MGMYCFCRSGSVCSFWRHLLWPLGLQLCASLHRYWRNVLCPHLAGAPARPHVWWVETRKIKPQSENASKFKQDDHMTWNHVQCWQRTICNLWSHSPQRANECLITISLLLHCSFFLRIPRLGYCQYNVRGEYKFSLTVFIYIIPL